MNVIHFSKTPLAGAPIRIVQALQQHTDHHVRLVDLERWGIFDHDVVHIDDPEKVFELAEKADIVHLHNYLDYDSKDFYPVDFDALQRKGKLFVRHFHSSPMLVASAMGVSVTDLLSSPMPSLVLAQFQERFYPKARVVPNIIPQDDPDYRPSSDHAVWGVFFSPISMRSAWDDRWNTKGAPETLSLMKHVARRTGCKTKCVSGRPLTEVMREKRRSRLLIDDLVTGSYHLSGLEGLSLGKPVLAYVDDRTQHVLRDISGSHTCPFINVRLEDASNVLSYLLKHPDEMTDIGKASRSWIERHWADRTLAQHFVDVYEKLLTDPALVVRQDSLRPRDSADRFFSVTLPDLVYETRAQRSHSLRTVITTALRYLKLRLGQIAQRLATILPGPVLRSARSARHAIGKLFQGIGTVQ